METRRLDRDGLRVMLAPAERQKPHLAKSETLTFGPARSQVRVRVQKVYENHRHEEHRMHQKQLRRRWRQHARKLWTKLLGIHLEFTFPASTRKAKLKFPMQLPQSMLLESVSNILLYCIALYSHGPECGTTH